MPDILIQRWIHQRDLKMTHSEMKQEQKDMFGSPEIRRARKPIQSEIARETTPRGIQNARVAIVGQSVAVGIRYVPTENQAPETVARIGARMFRNVAGCTHAVRAPRHVAEGVLGT